MNTPLVTVIVPNYNHARFLPRRLDSVLGQTFTDFELLLMDDCSTDASVPILQRYAVDPRSRLLLNTANSGSTFKQWKKGLAEAKGKYIWIAESDDFASPRLLERLVSLLENHPNVGIAYCESNNINEHDEILSTSHRDFKGVGDPTRWDQDFIVNGKQECADFMLQMNTIPNASAVVFRRETYVQAGTVDDSMRLCGDWKLWSLMLLQADLAHVTEPMNFFRFHSQNVRSSTRQWQGILEAMMVVDLIRHSAKVGKAPLEFSLNWLADVWINAWLHRQSVDADKRQETYKKLKAFDPTFNRRVVSRFISRSIKIIRKGRMLRWGAHVIQKARVK